MTLKHVSGFRELEAVLRKLPQNVEHRVLQSATMAAARVIRKNVKAKAPRSVKGDQSPSSKLYKHLYQNIKVEQLRRARKKGMRGARVVTGDAFWGRFLEFGTRFISASPWFRPAVSESADPAVDKMKDALVRGIEREATKLARVNKVF